jgi:zinc D-Ala-D-Ala carboxypeptidase
MGREVSLKELLFSETATRLGIDNTPTDQILINLQTLIYEVITPIVNHFGDIKITSGYRSPALCKAIGSSDRSQHTTGMACDFEVLGYSNQEVSLWIVKNLEFDQCILEFWKPEEINSGWVHVSYNKDGNRKMYLRAYKANGRTVYEVL